MKFSLYNDIILAAIFMLLGTAAAHAAPIVANGTFDKPYHDGGTQTFTTDSNGGSAPSAAAQWRMFNDTAGTTSTDLEPSSLVAGGTMIHVSTTALESGLYQDFPQHGPTNVFTCDWLYVVSGAVGIGSGLEAFTTIDGGLFKTGSWEVLNVGNQSTPAYTTIIYNIGQGPAEFYVESVQVSASHAQCKAR